MLRAAAAGLLLLVPVFWAGRPQAVDLPSHTYNLWLAQLVRSGQAPGVSIEPIWINTLADRLMDLLVAFLPLSAAELCLWSVAVLTLGAGSMLWIRAMAGAFPWALLPFLAVFVHGSLTQGGFTGFLLSVGLGAAAGAAPWWAAIVLALLGILSNPMGAGMMLALTVYIRLARRWESKWLFVAALALIALVAAGLRWFLPYIGGFHPLTPLGLALVTPYRIAYLAPACLMGGALGALLWRIDRQAWRTPLAQALFLAIFACLVMPNGVRFPGHEAPFTFVSLRISLAVVLAALALLASRPLAARPAIAGGVAVAGVYFALLFQDHRAFRRLDGELARAVAALPPGTRAALVHRADGYLLDPLAHALDRACLGHCFSYFNYEPASHHFRIRAKAGNRVVEPDRRRIQAFEIGELPLRDADLPLTLVTWDQGRWTVREALPGEVLRRTPIPIH